MRDKKYYIALDDFERRVVVNCLNEMRNNLIANGKYTDAVDEVLLKIIDPLLTLFSLMGGSLGIIFAIILFDKKAEKREYDV